MYVVLAYDISNNKRRNSLRKLLLGYGEPVQLSVFECDVNKRDFRGLQAKVKRIIKSPDDSVRYYYLCRDCQNKIEVTREEDSLRNKKLLII